MDLVLLGRVLGRHPVVVSLGILMATALAFLSFVKVDPFSGGPRFTYRSDEQWVSRTTLQVTERGFPEGRSVIDLSSSETIPDGTQFAQPGRFSGLAALYAELVDSDPVRAMSGFKRTPGERIEADALTTPTDEALPLVRVAGIAPNPDRALNLVERQTQAFIRYVLRQQEASKVKPADRVELHLVSKASTPVTIAGRSKALPVVVFGSVMLAMLALAFALEGASQRRNDAVGAVTLTTLPETEEPPLGTPRERELEPNELIRTRLIG